MRRAWISGRINLALHIVAFGGGIWWIVSGIQAGNDAHWVLGLVIDVLVLPRLVTLTWVVLRQKSPNGS